MIKKIQCRSIYEEAFGKDDEAFENLLFKTCFKYCKFTTVNNKIVSMLFALPCLLKTSSDTFNATYIYAAATQKESRGKGYMGNLLASIKKDSDFVFLKPQTNTLIEYYKRFEFTEIPAKKDLEIPIIEPLNDFKKLIKKLKITTSSEKYTAMFYSNKQLDIESLNFVYTME